MYFVVFLLIKPWKISDTVHWTTVSKCVYKFAFYLSFVNCKLVDGAYACVAVIIYESKTV